MPRPKNLPYQYGATDSPVTLADKYGITPTQLIDANPGGYPFSQGQTINIPQFGPVLGNQGVVGPTMYGPPKPTGITGVPPVGYGPQKTPSTNFGSGYVMQPNAITNTFPWLAGNQPTALPESTGAALAGTQQLDTATGQTTMGVQTNNSDYANTRAAQYYEAQGTPFLKQKRWDPQAKEYVSIGRLIKQGKLDLQGNWHKRSNRQRATNAQQNRQQAQQKQQQDFTLANSLIDFGASSG